MRKYWTKARLKISLVNFKFHVWCQNSLQIFNSFQFCWLNTFLGLVSFCVTNFPWQVSHYSGISNILGAPRKFRFHLHNFTQWPYTNILLRNFLNWAPTVQIILSTTFFHASTASRPIKPRLVHSTTFLTQSPKVHIPSNKNMIKLTTAIPQSLVPTS